MKTDDRHEQHAGLAELLAFEREDRRAYVLLVRELVAEEVRDLGQVGWMRLFKAEDDTALRWQMLALAVSRAALGHQGVTELAEMWELAPDWVREQMAEHQRRMRHRGAFFEYRQQADELARRVMRLVEPLKA